MPADMYSDSPDAPAQAEPEGHGEGMEGGQSAVLPKSILAGKEFKPGDEVVLRIDSIHGDEVMVSYAPEKGGDDSMGEEGGEAAPAQAPAPSGGSSMYD